MNVYKSAGASPDSAAPFVPLEQHFPLWREARAILEGLLPRQITMISMADAGMPNAVGIDFTWLGAFMKQAPREYTQSVFDVVEAAVAVMISELPMKRFEKFLLQGVNAQTFHRINMSVDEIDMERQKDGQPSFLSLLGHGLGLAPRDGTPIVSMGGTGGNHGRLLH